MEINLDKKGWPAIITGIDLRCASQQEINTIVWLTLRDTVVVIRNQNLSPGDQVDFCEKIGECEQILPPDAPTQGTKLVEGGRGKIIRVGGGNHYGSPGIQEHVSDANWHSERTGTENRDPLLWLYAFKYSEGSRTSWINNILSYNDLDNKIKNEIKNYRMIMGYDARVVSEDTTTITKRNSNDINHDWYPNLVRTNEIGLTGLYFPFLQIDQILDLYRDESDEFIQKLRLHVEQEKYIYHHDWQDGDVVLSDQWMGVHKRWRYENISNRIVHRIPLNFQHCNLADIVI